MSWSAIIWAGFIATTLAAAFFWVTRSFGWTKFSPTTQLGCLFFRDPRGPATESLGLLVLFGLGSTLLPFVYQFLLVRSIGLSAGGGAILGLLHGAILAALLPSLGTISACVRHGFMPPPGRFGLAWGWMTPAAVVAGHALYGGIVGAILAAF